ncbi:hypothetical protein ACH4TE_01050 [Streptomyces sioyaensis]|uniref:hypothetical protein n=1 Tax=Streptomyces sioyaensis TaxID=67364 RepID=UPI0037A1A9CD
MSEESDNEVRISPAVRAALCVVSVLLAGGLVWTVNQSLGWWNPGVGWMSAKLAAKASVVLFVGLVALLAWLKKRG